MDLIQYYSDDEQDSTLNVVCEICQRESRKYKCPGCGISTCSLTCCKAHKNLSGCNGRRNRVDYVGMGQYKESNLINDFHFLEDVLQTKDRGKRMVENTSNLESLGVPKDRKKTKKQSVVNPLPHHLQILVDAAKFRGTNLILMSTGMTKRSSNTTRLINKANLIIWKIDIIFILDNNYDIPEVLRCFGDSKIRNSVISTTITVKESESLDQVLQSNFFSPSSANASIRHSLRSIRMNYSNLKCCLQHIPSISGKTFFYEVPLIYSIRDALKDKTVIEYPTFFIGVYQNMQKFQLKICTLESCAGDTNIFDKVTSDEGDSLSEEENSEDNEDIEIIDNAQIELIASEIGKRSLDDLGRMLEDQEINSPKRALVSANT